MEADRKTCRQVLSMVPQRHPFRFINIILEMDEDHIIGMYRFRSDEYFYPGHFPEYPVTPGVILIETMAQTGVVAFGLYLNLLQGKKKIWIEEHATLFAFVEKVDFSGVVSPGEIVRIEGRKIYFRRDQLKVECSMTRMDGEKVCSGILAGKGVPREQFLKQTMRQCPFPLRSDGMREEVVG